jgi:hypothetical protein
VWNDINKVDLRGIEFRDVNWVQLAHDIVQ